ncbi:MAG: amino acid adenylation domain-containing protein [Leptolyngbya sp. SIOISBB]|nr:amino acid adenylation domain-containing protein [Leptolyngbya sp. SIOISBB]
MVSDKITFKAQTHAVATDAGDEVFVFPTSSAQQRLWFVEQLEPGSPLYNIPAAVRLTGVLNVTALEQSFNEIVQRHEVLRTRFLEIDGQSMQVVLPDLTVPINPLDWRSLSPTEQDAEMQRLAQSTAQASFDLSQVPLLRVTLIRQADQVHVLLLTMHHIISDGWSMGVLIRELAALYDAFATGRPASLPELPIQYADYAIWQQQWLQTELEPHLAYWRQQLAPPIVPLQLRSDNARSTLSVRGATQSHILPSQLTAALKAFSQQASVTLFMTLLTGFNILLYRYTEQDDVAIASGIANRNRQELEGLIGFFVNTLVLRTDLSGNPSVRDVLQRVRDVTLEAYTHQDCPFEKIVETLQPDRTIGSRPFPQVGFMLQNMPLPTLNLTGLTLERLPIYTGAAEAELTLVMQETEQGLISTVEYRTDLFQPETIARFLQHYEAVLQAMITQPDLAIATLPLLNPDAQRSLLEQWSQIHADHPTSCLHHQIERQAARTPAAIAIIDGRTQLTYQDLNQRANQLAHYLQQMGIEPEIHVGICLERSPHVLIALLAVLKAGAAYVPIDPAYPPARIAAILDDAQVKLLLTQTQCVAALPSVNAAIVQLDQDWEAISQQPTTNPVSAVTLDNLAYLIYTSGSTGTPKGVMIPHRSLASYVEAAIRTYELIDGDRVLQFASISFDASVEEIYPTLTVGATLILRPDEMLSSPTTFWQTGEQHQLSVLSLPTAYWHELAASLDDEIALPTSIRLVIIGGEAVLPERVKQWCEHAPSHIRLLNTYGPTEATVVATAGELSAANSGLPKITIGRSLPHIQTYVLDTDLQPVPAGIPGALYLGGLSLARGYLNRPELTAERFVPNPFGGVGSREWGRGNGARPNHSLLPLLYKTGDRVCHLPDGSLEFLGRTDDQVKIRGFRVELGEIETVLRQYPLVQEEIVLARDTEGDLRLVAYVVAKSDAEVDEASPAQVTQWEAVFDDLYQAVDSQQENQFYIKGWTSSYTGQLIPEAEVRDWMNQTVARIQQLQPQRVLDLGCGTGLMLFRIAPQCQRYWGTDLSANALQVLQHEINRSQKDLSAVTLMQRSADNFSGIAPHSVDAVFIVSVAQYFPTIDYLRHVLEQAVQAVAPGGFIFLGDLRSLPLLEAFHTSVQLAHAEDQMAIADLRQRIQQQVLAEKQLVIDPAFFQALQQHLPRISQVELLLERGQAHNELTKFRYDVILHIETAVDAPEVDWIKWQPDLTLDLIRDRLTTQPAALGIAQVPNGRLVYDLRAVDLLHQATGQQTVGELRRSLQTSPTPIGIDPEEFWCLEPSHTVQIQGSERADWYDVIFWRNASQNSPWRRVLQATPKPAISVKPWRDYANNPLPYQRDRDFIPELRQFLKTKLPAFMMPSAVVRLDALPRTPSGKVDRQALPLPDAARPDSAQPFTAAITLVQELLVTLWSQILGVEQVGIHDNFFELGGHSLLATQLVAKMRDRFQIELPLRTLFESPTIASLSRQIEAARTATSVTPAMQRLARPDRLPLSFAQQRLWVLTQLDPEQPAYNIAGAVRIRGQLRLTALEQSFNVLLQRHESLRTAFITIDDQPCQVVLPSLTLTLPVIHLRTAITSDVQQALVEEARRSFDLTQPPLIRGCLFQLAEADFILSLTLHHIIADGWSMGVLVQELAACYQACLHQKSAILTDLPVQYADFTLWQRQWLQGDVLASQLDYWTRQLSGMNSVLSLPTDYPRPAMQTYRGAQQVWQLTADRSAQLHDLSQQAGVTLFMTLLTAFQILLHWYTGQTDISVGTDSANRRWSETEGLIGFFVNQLVLRTDLSGDPTLRELLQQVRSLTLDAYAHQDLPFDKLVDVLKPERSLSYTPLFQTKLVLQNTPMPPLELEGLTLNLINLDNGTAKFDLLFNLAQTEQGLAGVLEYNTDLFAPESMTRFLRQWDHLLAQIVIQPDARLNVLTQSLTECDRHHQTTQAKARQDRHYQKLKLAQRQPLRRSRQAIALSTADLVQTSCFAADQSLPLVIQPAVTGVNLIDWAAHHRDWIEAQLRQQGGLLFRNFQIRDAAIFQQLVQTVAGPLWDYCDRTSPRSPVSGQVYTSTDYPAHQAIPLHSENAYAHTFPGKLFFCCPLPAQQGGETPIADIRKVYQRLDPDIRDRFQKKQVMYVRNFSEGLGLLWQTVFQTTDPQAVEQYCAAHGIEWEWRSHQQLRTRQIRPAIARHPQTGEWVWFNHAAFFHSSTLEPSLREALLTDGDELNLPHNTFYGDGSVIEPEIIATIRAAYQQETVMFSWQAGDLLMLDNLLTAHGRSPYQGQRQVLVGMAEPMSSRNLSDQGAAGVTV